MDAAPAIEASAESSKREAQSLEAYATLVMPPLSLRRGGPLPKCACKAVGHDDTQIPRRMHFGNYVLCAGMRESMPRARSLTRETEFQNSEFTPWLMLTMGVSTNMWRPRGNSGAMIGRIFEQHPLPQEASGVTPDPPIEKQGSRPRPSKKADRPRGRWRLHRSTAHAARR